MRQAIGLPAWGRFSIRNRRVGGWGDIRERFRLYEIQPFRQMCRSGCGLNPTEPTTIEFLIFQNGLFPLARVAQLGAKFVCHSDAAVQKNVSEICSLVENGIGKVKNLSMPPLFSLMRRFVLSRTLRLPFRPVNALKLSIAPYHLRPAKVRFFHLRSTEVCSLHLRPAEVCPGNPSRLEVRTIQLRGRKIRALQ
jgi:hypothetical protein